MGIFKRAISQLILGLVAVFVFTGCSVNAQTITQGYDAEVSVGIQRGMIVGLVEDDPKKVEPINNSAAKRIHGVVVNSGDTSIVLAEESQTIYVASGGKFDVLVSDQNGTIYPGDYIALSSVSGIGMRSDELQEIVLGKAIDGYEAKDKISSITVKDAQDKDRELAIGRIQVDISIIKNPILKSSTSLPSFLQEASEFVAGKPVNPIRVYLSMAVLFAAAAVAGALIYSGVRSGMIAIGRNPLSKKSIFRDIIQVVIIGITIFLVGIFGVYLLLKL